MNEDVRSAEGIDLSNVQRCRIHGLMFDREITDVCPLCEHERTQRIAGALDR